ncbi:MAG: hypothetical protein ACJ0Q2_04045 [Candidatus Azotimanducaceae bacterium]
MEILKLGVLYSEENFPSRPSWMHSFSQAPNVVLLDDRIRMYLCCRPEPDPDGMYVSRVGYIDLDINDPFKILGFSPDPVLSLGGLGEFDEFGTYPVSVARMPDGNLVAAYGGWTRCVSVPFDISIGLAFSSDEGQTFQKIGNGPVLSKNPEDPFVITSPKIRYYDGKWYLYYTCGTEWIQESSGRPEIIYRIKMASSADLITWDRKGSELIQNKIGEDEAQASPDVIKIGKKYHMFYCYRKSLNFRRDKSGSYRIGHAESNDLVTWKTTKHADSFEASEKGFDNEMVAYPNVFELNKKHYLIYAGNGNGKTGLGLAVIGGLNELEV